MRKHIRVIILLNLIFISCKEKKASINITTNHIHNTVDQLTKIMIHDVFSPPVASRIYVYPNIAAYEALSYNNKSYKTLSKQLNEFKTLPKIKLNNTLNKKLAALIAYMEVSEELVFSKQKLITYKDSLYSNWININKDEFNEAKMFGKEVANHVKLWMNDDKYIETRNMPIHNVLTKDPFSWVPTPPAFMPGIEPHWNKIRPLIMKSADQFKPEKPPTPSFEKSSDFYKELIGVYNIGNKIIKEGNTSEKLNIAKFWDCNPYVSVNKGHFMFAEKKITPGAHWIGICKIACKESNSSFKKTIYAYTKTAIAINDAFISCWDEKYRSNLVRPETLINNYIDDNWLPLLQTPPFPEYTSGHSVVSGAASEILTKIFGDNFKFDDTTELPYGLGVRTFSSFRDAANEAALSRFYGGIHYMSAVKLGLEQGKKIGHYINNSVTFKNK
ncbi:phosphatase PAP2 family protein [Olleya aquimaris]|nr:phosphatase PAP2 family protein [Olleya aquimaris]